MKLSVAAALALVVLTVPSRRTPMTARPLFTGSAFTRITPTGPFRPRRLSPARPHRSQRSRRRVSFRTLRPICPAKATRMASVAIRIIATKGASAATPADRIRPAVGPAFPLEALR
jgi:hypothetical protein